MGWAYKTGNVSSWFDNYIYALEVGAALKTRENLALMMNTPNSETIYLTIELKLQSYLGLDSDDFFYIC